MINEKEFINLFKRVNKFTIKTKIEVDDELINEINNIRISYKHLKKELDYKRVYPNHNLEKARIAYEETKSYCKEVKFVRNFDIENLKNCNGKYVNFFIDNYEITDIIDLSL